MNTRGEAEGGGGDTFGPFRLEEASRGLGAGLVRALGDFTTTFVGQSGEQDSSRLTLGYLAFIRPIHRGMFFGSN